MYFTGIVEGRRTFIVPRLAGVEQFKRLPLHIADSRTRYEVLESIASGRLAVLPALLAQYVCETLSHFGLPQQDDGVAISIALGEAIGLSADRLNAAIQRASGFEGLTWAEFQPHRTAFAGVLNSMLQDIVLKYKR